MFSRILHPTDYPLFLPTVVAWGWNWMGTEAFAWPPLVALSFALSCVVVVMWYLASYVSRLCALWCGSFLLMTHAFVFWSTALYAEVPFSFFVTASVLTFITALRTRQLQLFLLAGFLTGMTTWIKNEGLPFCFYAVSSFIVLLVFLKSLPYKQKAQIALLFILGLSIPVSAHLTVKFLYGGPSIYFGRQFLFSKQESPGLIIQSLSETAQSIKIGNIMEACKLPLMALQTLTYAKLYNLGGPQINLDQIPKDWNFIWYLFPIAIFFNFFLQKGNFKGSYLWLMMAFILLMDLGYFIALWMTWKPIFAQTMAFAPPRLLVHNSVLAIVFLFETFTLPLVQEFRA
ncbi:MAG: hypothetical protein NC930_07425 [Candidatus Omnitrophica bacterium]|nr:hypothetical protein [Candidatus Omnitrophota bacterium]